MKTNDPNQPQPIKNPPLPGPDDAGKPVETDDPTNSDKFVEGVQNNDPFGDRDNN